MFVVHEHIGARGSRESNLEEKRRKRASERKRNSERTRGVAVVVLERQREGSRKEGVEMR